jgi:hypothetical protein
MASGMSFVKRQYNSEIALVTEDVKSNPLILFQVELGRS